MSRQARLSVLMPNFNHARFLRESLGAILAQSYRPDEIIVIDDCSTDNSVEVIKEFAATTPHLRLICNPSNMGVEPNVNRLLHMAAGEYVMFAAADDKVLPGFFEKSMALLESYPQAALCSTAGFFINEDGSRRGIRTVPVVAKRPRFFSPKEVLQTLHRYGRWISTPTVILRRDALIEEGGQPVELGSFADTFINLVLALKYGACYIPEPLTCWRVMPAGNAARTAADSERLLKIGKRASTLMRTTYSRLFPVSWVDTFDRQWMYAVSATAGSIVFGELERKLRQAQKLLFPNQSAAGSLFWLAMRGVVRTQSLLWWLYAALRFAPWRWWVSGRLSILLNLGKLAVCEKRISP